MKDKINKIVKWLVLAYIFLIPWQAVYIFNERLINGAKSQFLTGQIYASELFLAAIILLWLANNFDLKKISGALKNFRLQRTQNLFIIFLWLFIAYSGLSILWSADKSAGYYLWLHLLETAALLLLVLNSNLSRIKIFWAIMLSAVLQGLLAAWQFLSQDIGANKWLGISAHSAGQLGDIVIETADGRWLRAYGSFGHPNILAGFLALGLISGLLLWLEAKNSQKQLLIILVSCLIISAGIFFAFSRSAWLALALILPFLAYSGLKCFADREKRRFATLISGIISVFLMLAYLFWPLISTRADLSNRLEAISTGDRFSQITQAWAIIAQNQLWGVGINNYTVELAQIYPYMAAYGLQPAHNAGLLILAELGLIGLALLIILLILALKSTIYESNNLIYLAPLGAMLAISIFDHYFWTQYSGLMISGLALTIWLKYYNIDNHGL